MGKIVINVKEISNINDIYGPYARRKCQVTTLEDNKQENTLSYLDENSILEDINSYITYLNSQKNNNYGQENFTLERRTRNMKATPFYSVGLVLILLAIFSEENNVLPLVIAGIVVILLTVIIANGLFLPKKKSKNSENLNLETEIKKAEELYKVAENEIARKSNLDITRNKLEKQALECKKDIISKLSIEKTIKDLRDRAKKALF